ncbi:hypothetical protein ACJJTC_016068 [Scirpophaga incertulas]
MLATWLETNKTTKWAEGIKFIQFMKNKAHHSGISRSRYEAMFGCKAKVGLKTFLPALETMSDITSEEDLEAMVKNQNGQASEDIDTNLERSINNDIHTEITTEQATIESGPSDKEESISTNQLKENDDGNNVEKDKNEENIYEPNETKNNPESDNEQVFNENTAVQAIHVCSQKIEEARIGARQSLEILTLDPDNSEHPEDVEDKYFSVLSKIDQQLNAINITKERTPSTPVSCKINLPNIVLNTFNDEPLNLIKNLPLPPESYSKAIEILNSRYNNKYRAFQMERDTEEEPTIAAFLAYMEKRALALENADPGYKSSGQHR